MSPNHALQRTPGFDVRLPGAALIRPVQSRAVLPAMKPGTARAFASRRRAATRAPGPESLSLGSLGAENMRLLAAIVFGAVLSGCYVPGRGYAESQFDLVLDSRLPKFFDPAGHISPVGYKARTEYYSSPSSVRVIIYDPSGRKVFDKQEKCWWHPLDDKEHPAAHYPNHTVVSFDGIMDILEQRKPEPFEHLSDDKTLWDALKPST